METWKATIKEVGNKSPLETTYTLTDDMFRHIKDEKQKEYEIRKFLINFWGLNNKDVEWFFLEKITKRICCICKKEFDGYGNNPYPIKNEGRCCEECNWKIVMPERLRLILKT